MRALSEAKLRVIAEMDVAARLRDHYIRRSRYYYQDLLRLLRFSIPSGSSVLEIGCGTGHVLAGLSVSPAVGIDISQRMASIARAHHPHLRIAVMDAEHLALKARFDTVIVSDCLGYFEDIQAALRCVWSVCDPDTRIIITYHSFLWQPILMVAEKIRLKMPQKRLNWLNIGDIRNLLLLEGFDVVKEGRRFLCPRFIPIVSWFINRIAAHLPLMNRLCITGFVVARRSPEPSRGTARPSVTVVVPARNEKGNIQEIVQRVPVMGSGTELVFVEGHSTDGTLDEIRRVCEAYRGPLSLHWVSQPGKGKGDAVRQGFALATGDHLMILDADLTVQPEDLPKFYDALFSGRGEFVNGTRLVYPIEKEAMRALNMFGNKFFSTMFTWILGQRLKDTLCGTKALSRVNWDRIAANRSYFGDFDPFGDFDLIFGAAKLNLKIVEVPVRYGARRYGTTNISRFSHGWLLLKMLGFAMQRMKFT